MGVVYSCFKKLPSNLSFILYSFHCSFGERILFVVERGLNFSFDDTLDSHPAILFERPENVVIAL